MSPPFSQTGVNLKIHHRGEPSPQNPRRRLNPAAPLLPSSLTAASTKQCTAEPHGSAVLSSPLQTSTTPAFHQSTRP
ncbi:hypothetical protein M0R45_036300 [Rubus argutus]|uniref:Uncharacterized protein n=1 Tax=Rubus argutus TaxID=59490 RepID=A0AAW1VX49_RUBAR